MKATNLGKERRPSPRFRPQQFFLSREDIRRNFHPKFEESRTAGSRTGHGASTPSTTKPTFFRIAGAVATSTSANLIAIFETL